jgi:hypothetical protein
MELKQESEIRQELHQVVEKLSGKDLNEVFEFVQQKTATKQAQPLRPSQYIDAILAKHDNLFKRLA